MQETGLYDRPKDTVRLRPMPHTDGRKSSFVDQVLDRLSHSIHSARLRAAMYRRCWKRSCGGRRPSILLNVTCRP